MSSNEQPIGAIPVERGCGRRKAGGIYLEVGLSANGRPLEEFLMCPPRRVDLGAIGAAAVGQHIIRIGNDTHVLDVVGAKDYRNVADVLEEGRRFGFSRKFSPLFDFKALKPGSLLLLAHPRGWPVRFRDYHNPPDGTAFGGCRQGLADRPHDLSPCCGCWYDDVQAPPDDIEPHPVPAGDERAVIRTMPSFSYEGRRPPEGVETEYAVAIIAALPITRFVVVRDPQDGTHDRALDRLHKAGIDADLVDE